MIAPLVVALSFAAAPKVVAPEWTGVDVKRELLVFYSSALAESLRRNGLEVVTAQDVSTLLGIERQKQLLGCADDGSSCMAELANALGCDATLVVNLARFDDGGFSGVARLISSRDGRTLSSVKLDAPSERGLLDSLERAGDVLASPLTQRTAAAPAVHKPWTPRRLWWAPSVVGLVGLGAGAGLLLGARGAFDGLLTEPSESAARGRAATGQALQTGGFIALGVGGAALAAAVVFFLWPDAPVAPAVTFSPVATSLTVQGAF